MKIMNALTLRYLKVNKKRTILTILCITVSVIMICSIGISFYSGKQYYKDYIEKSEGDYHYTIVDNDKRIVDMIQNDEQVESYSLSNTSTYYIENNSEEKNYFYLKRGDHSYFKNYDMEKYIVQGKLPQNSHEIAISQSYLQSVQKEYLNIGDSITLISQDEEKQKTFLIVGFIETYNQNYYRTPTTYDAISYINLEDEDAYFSLYIRDKDVSKNIFDHVESLNQKIKEMKNIESMEDNIFQYHSNYLAIQDIFEANSQSTFLIVYRMVAIILFVVMIISFFIIYQAFHLSTYDRIQYLGMLSSIGATRKQKMRSVYYEGILLSLIAIPLGILFSFIGLSIAFSIINQFQYLKDLQLSIHTSISLQYLLIVIILSFIVIMISLYLPAKKISQISVIDALKKSDEVKVKAKKLKQNSFLKKHLSMTQQLAIKNYKRQGKRSRVIILSLSVSMIAFISIYSFGQKMMQQIESNNNFHNYDVISYLAEENIKTFEQYVHNNNKIDNYIYFSNLTLQMKLDESYLNFSLNDTYQSHEGDYYDISLIGVCNEKYEEICRDNHIQVKDRQGLLVNGRMYIENNQSVDKKYHHMDSDFIKEMKYVEKDYVDGYEMKVIYEKEYDLFDSLELIDNDEYQLSSAYTISIIVPLDTTLHITQNNALNIEGHIQTKKHEEVTNELNNLDLSAHDYANDVQQERDSFFIIQIFVYGFVCILILFALLNIINMMSASIHKRQKEFGMLLSVGMSPKDIQKKILYECLIYGLKTLLYGVPISIAIEYLLYLQLNTENIHFMPAIVAYIISFIVIMLVMVLTFKIGLSKFKKQNIIETLKDDM